MKPIGIKTKDDENRIRARGELITNPQHRLIADLGNGYFVVTQKTAQELTEKGVEYKEIEIINGIPTHIREYIKDAYPFAPV